ncbi:MAG: delta-60 repeat domain-containing protein [Flavobacteriales bacterium]|nr:delta-60 repeat domain-containing protein [Flavobacteriales bacterium]
MAGPRPLLSAFIAVFVGSGLFAQDGALDLSFDPGTGFNHIVTAIEVQPDGKILAAGLFTTYNGTSCDHITRLNANGSLDGTFTQEAARTAASTPWCFSRMARS